MIRGLLVAACVFIDAAVVITPKKRTCAVCVPVSIAITIAPIPMATRRTAVLSYEALHGMG